MNNPKANVASNANRLSWEGLYSWNEPVAGSRREWKNDHWRFWKIGICVVPVFFVCAWAYGSLTLSLLECMAGITVFAYAYLWLLSFFPRYIVLFEDRISLFRSGSKGASAAIRIYFSEIKEMNVTSENGMCKIELKLVSGKEVILYSLDANSVSQLDKLLGKSNATRTP
jgi:hypothetical protein